MKVVPSCSNIVPDHVAPNRYYRSNEPSIKRKYGFFSWPPPSFFFKKLQISLTLRIVLLDLNIASLGRTHYIQSINSYACTRRLLPRRFLQRRVGNIPRRVSRDPLRREAEIPLFYHTSSRGFGNAGQIAIEASSRRGELAR